tara:strand:- start:32 stop:778 length:747 start_codon:yes stop_codon:yes gene_type:complete
MQFALYTPDTNEDIPVLYFLSGITCTEQNFIQKSGYQKFASEHQMAIVVPDTSPRGKGIPDSESYKLGWGAGFYLNATEDPWSLNYNMYDYITKELPQIIGLNFQFSKSKIGIFGHSMGGGGAIQCALKNQLYKSVSAFSPICSIHQSEFAKEARQQYLNNNYDNLNLYDPLFLIEKTEKKFEQIKIDVGLDDEFFNDLFIDDFQELCKKNNQNLTLNKHEGFDHGYFFIQSFIEKHIKYHASFLNNL